MINEDTPHDNLMRKSHPNKEIFFREFSSTINAKLNSPKQKISRANGALLYSTVNDPKPAPPRSLFVMIKMAQLMKTTIGNVSDSL